MNIEEQIALLRDGTEKWNSWRKEHPNIAPSLRDVNFVAEFSGDGFYDLPVFSNTDFSGTDFNMVSFRNCQFCDCCFDGAKITFADLVDSYFESCTFRNVNMRVTAIGNAAFNNCIFENSDLSYCSAEKTSFKGSSFKNTKLEHMSLVANDFSDTQLFDCNVYGISSWDLNLENSSQKDLIITPDDKTIITVDNIELAQFLYLIINNDKLRNVIDTITSKVVLILGNFSEERKKILDEIREKLRTYDLIPVMFDFEKPNSRNLTETVKTLAVMSRFVIVDISSPRSTPHEIANFAISLPSVSVYPIIVDSEKEFGMFADYASYPWIKPITKYNNQIINQVIDDIVKKQKS